MSSSKTPQNLDLFQSQIDESEMQPKHGAGNKRKAANALSQPTHLHLTNGFAERYITVQELAQRYGLSKSSVWRLASEDKGFPKPIKLAEGTTRWPLSKLLEYEYLRSEVSKRKGK